MADALAALDQRHKEAQKKHPALLDFLFSEEAKALARERKEIMAGGKKSKVVTAKLPAWDPATKKIINQWCHWKGGNGNATQFHSDMGTTHAEQFDARSISQCIAAANKAIGKNGVDSAMAASFNPPRKWNAASMMNASRNGGDLAPRGKLCHLLLLWLVIACF